MTPGASLVPEPVLLPHAVSRGRRLREIVAHLVRRELAASHRFSVLGAGWPLVRMLVQWAVLAFVFTALVDLSIHRYPAFLLCGLVAWSWFSAGVANGAAAVVERRSLLMQPGVPALALPAVAVGVALVDAMLALPILLAVLIASGGLPAAALLLPVLIVIQLFLTCGLAWLLAALTVYLRDVRSLVEVGLTVLFYLTPVFYAPDRVPESARVVVEYGPVAALVESWRAVLIEGTVPPARALLVATVAAVVAALAGLVVFRRLERGFVDHL